LSLIEVVMMNMEMAIFFGEQEVWLYMKWLCMSVLLFVSGSDTCLSHAYKLKGHKAVDGTRRLRFGDYLCI
jgi:hypothetical protein